MYVFTIQKYPSIVSKLHDVKVTHIAAGPDFVVTMDTEAGLWVWGRNDCGQVMNPSSLYMSNNCK